LSLLENTSFGTSMAYNISRGRPLLETLGMEFGPLYLEARGRNIDWYLIPGSVAGIVGGFARGNFSLESTLRYGTPIFYDSLTTEEKPWLRGTTYGFHGSNVLILDNNISDEGKNHEIIHSLQAQTYRNLSSILPAPYSKIENFLLRNHIDTRTIPNGLINHLQNLFLNYGYSLNEWEARVLSGTPSKLDPVLNRN